MDAEHLVPLSRQALAILEDLKQHTGNASPLFPGLRSIELQLAHAERNKVRAAHNRAQRLEERRTMMQAWQTISMGSRRAQA